MIYKLFLIKIFPIDLVVLCISIIALFIIVYAIPSAIILTLLYDLSISGILSSAVLASVSYQGLILVMSMFDKYFLLYSKAYNRG